MNFSNLFHYLLGVSLALAFDDLSRYKYATLSHIFYNSNTYAASNAVDRNQSTCMRTDSIGLTSTHKTAWWRVDLGGIYRIYSITIQFKSYDDNETRQRGRFAGFSLYVSADEDGQLQGSSLCYKDGPQLPPVNFTTSCITSGRYVTFYNERLDTVVYPRHYEINSVFTELCEVIVNGCAKPGVYGANCDIPCSINCKDNCHIENGECSACNPGWKDATCQKKCENGWYGENCSQPCVGNCRDNSSCNHVTGQCDVGCDVGWTGTMCEKECENGWYGESCFQQCVGNCRDESSCNHVTGQCDRGCNDGWTGALCENECENGWYGESCSQSCVGNCRDNSTCNHVTGHCDVGCDVGWTGTMCEKDICKDDLQTKGSKQPIFWIIGFSISVAVNAFFMTTCITLWKKANHKKPDNADVRYLRCARCTEGAKEDIAITDPGQYQEVHFSNSEMCYLNI